LFFKQVNFFSIESVKSADTEGLLSSWKESFERTEILNFGNGLNVDGASVNTGIHSGLGTRICDKNITRLGIIAYLRNQR